jgi:1,2-diacylglycerol 3-beta-glucosyltransferase
MAEIREFSSISPSVSIVDGNCMESVIGTLGLILVAFGLISVFALRWSAFRAQRALNVDPLPDSPASDYVLIALVACLNEEVVIRKTIESLLTQRFERIFVVDDGSSDRTAKFVRKFSQSGRVQLVRRVKPEAQKGKGEALNAGYIELCRWAEQQGHDPTRTIVAVMDADGRLSDGAAMRVLALFDDETIGGVQLGVQIRNTKTLLTQMQDFEFWGISAPAQTGRRSTRTVSLGGNGQFTRLSALLGLKRLPWSFSLTEDLDLALSLIASGWGITTRPDAYVDQQAVPELSRLLRQRTRWFQGHMACCRRLPEIRSTNHLSTSAMLEITSYLLTPFVLILPWSILFPLGLYEFANSMVTGSLDVSRVLVFYILSTAPMIHAAVAYRKRRPSLSRRRAFLLAHLLVPYNAIAFAATWKGLIRLLRGQNGWDKTNRVLEPQV